MGVEVAREAQRVVEQVSETSGFTLASEDIPCGGQYYLEHGRDWPEGSEEACRRADLILLGAVGWPAPEGFGPVTMADGRMAGWSAVIGNRTRLDLYANVRPVKMFEGVSHRISGEARSVWRPQHVNLVIIRENTEGLYAGAGGILTPGGTPQVAVDTRVITRRASERIIEMAFQTAMARAGAPADGRRRVTCVVKNNVLQGCRMFTQIFQEIGEGYPEVERDVANVDAFTQWLITSPERYDVVVTTNMFGDIITDLAAVLQGGMGMAVGMNVSKGHGMFEPIHGSAPDIAGQERANPLAMILAAGEGLRWLGGRTEDAALNRAANRIETAVRRMLLEGRTLPADLARGGDVAKTREVTDAVLRHLPSMDEVRDPLGPPRVV